MNVRALNTITKMKESDDEIHRHLRQLERELDIVNFVVLGRLFYFEIWNIYPNILQYGQYQQSVFYRK